MKYLVTGGLGFIGSNFIRYLLRENSDVEVINLDKVTYAADPKNLSDLKTDTRYTFVKGDICDRSLVDKLLSDADVVVHFAAESHVDRSIGGAATFVDTNIKGTYTLLDVAKEYSLKKFIQISTDEVYGQILSGSFKETDPLAPRNPYSATKASAELLARSYYITHNLPVVVTRSSNNFGPYQHPEKLIPRFVTNALRDKPLPVYGTGKNVRDWLYVLDNCEAIDLVAKKGKVGEVYNIGGGNELQNIEITHMILDILNKPETLVKFVEDRKGHDFRYSLDISKIKRELGWAPKYNFRSALQETIQWYVDNREWWANKVVD